MLSLTNGSDSRKNAAVIGSIPILQIAHRLEVWGYTNSRLPPQAGIESAQADFVSIAAISNRQVFLQKWDAPL
jgi:hypothetical protein